MKRFRYSGYDADGRAKAGFLDADGAREARATLLQQGVLPATLEEDEGSFAGRDRPIRPDARSILYRELATLLKAGIPLLTALQSVSAMPEFERAQRRLGVARDRIREGAGLGEAIEEADLGATPFERAAIDAGMRAGVLEESLERLAHYIQEKQAVRARINSALAYPLVVAVFALIVAGVMLGFVLPSALAMIRRSGVQADLPAVTRAMLSLRRTGVWLVPGVAGLAFLLGAWIRRKCRDNEAFRAAVDRAAMRIPLIGRARRLMAAFTFARTFAMLLRGGVAAEEGLALAGRACGSAWIERLSREEGESVRHGRSLADAVRRIPPLAPHLASWIQTGESAGSLPVMLDHAADRTQQQWDRLTTRLLGLLEPALILAVGGLVFLVVLSIILPLIRMNAGLAA